MTRTEKIARKHEIMNSQCMAVRFDAKSPPDVTITDGSTFRMKGKLENS
ncbi:hypothetical protein TcasGA2_TC012385 [Tribolium castaneum]|uniref:Uncharacterized protein n=1 Tax=Tribolium castaneum TaxID=7070 RepID=D6X1Z8_TRICA|nr:hypothetical protein TcasGA2_TC012385 [Tribolium castaneum]